MIKTSASSWRAHADHRSLGSLNISQPPWGSSSSHRNSPVLLLTYVVAHNSKAASFCLSLSPPQVQNGKLRFVFLVHHLAAGPPDHRLAPEHHARGPVRPHQPPHHLPGLGPPLRPAPGGRQHRPNVRQQHAPQQAPVLRPAEDCHDWPSGDVKGQETSGKRILPVQLRWN